MAALGTLTHVLEVAAQVRAAAVAHAAAVAQAGAQAALPSTVPPASAAG